MELALDRFRSAHEEDYETALREIKSGRKQSHWMWYIFPQLQGLGKSATAQYYALSDLEEARQFLADPYLGANLRQITRQLLALETNNALAVMGSPDHWKLKSCMTLFAHAAPEELLFHQVLDKFYGGRQDDLTIKLLHIS